MYENPMVATPKMIWVYSAMNAVIGVVVGFLLFTPFNIGSDLLPKVTSLWCGVF
jgi:hypothetical protein